MNSWQNSLFQGFLKEYFNIMWNTLTRFFVELDVKIDATLVSMR